MKALKIATATESTARAKAKATSNIQNEASQSLSSARRLTNLEMAVKHQAQQTYELYNKAKRAKTQKTAMEVSIRSN
jgi:hypothetical protein